jgi:chromosome segregation ATPase
MSDVLVPLTSPVFMIGLEDSETIDLHNKYSQLIKAYESLLEQRNEERKESRRQINAIQVASERLVAMQTSRGGSRMSARDEVELEMKVEQLEAKVKLLESGIDLSRKANEELEADLGTALEDGVRYRDSLSKMIEIRERELGYRAQEEALALSGGGIKAAAAEVTKLKRELASAGQLLEKEKAESKLLSNQVAELSAGHRAVHEDASMLRAQVNELERAQREGERQRREAEEVAEAKAAKERASMLKKVASLEEEVARLGEFQAEAQSLRVELEQARGQAKVQAQSRESEGGGDVSERQSAMAKIHDLDTELRQTRDELREAKEEIRRLEALVDSLRAEESR